MKLQKATRCALYAVLELAADPQRQMSASEIADKYGISLNHLAKVLRSLGREGLVEAVRGAGAVTVFRATRSGRLFSTSSAFSKPSTRSRRGA